MKSENLIFKDLESMFLPWMIINLMMKLILEQHITYFNKKIADKKDAVQIPLIFFSDGTVVDIAGRHSCLLLEYSSKH